MTDGNESIIRLNQLVDRLVEVKNGGKKLDGDVTKQTNQVLKWLEVNKEVKTDNVDEILQILRQKLLDNPEITLEQIGENFVNKEGRDEFESKLDTARIKILLEEFDKHQGLKQAQEIAREAKKNPLLKGVSEVTLGETIEKKIRLQNEAERQGLSPTKADLVSDNVITMEKRLEEIGVDSKKAEEIATKVADIPTKTDSLAKAEEEIKKVFESETIERKIIEETLDQTLTATAEAIVMAGKEEITDKFIDDLKQEVNLDFETEKKVREVVNTRLEDEIEKSLPKVTENKIFVIGNTTRALGLVDEVIDIAGIDSKKRELEQMVLVTQKVTDNFILANSEEVGRLRKSVLESEVIKELSEKGKGVKEAIKTANDLGNFAYPQNKAGQMVKIDEAAIKIGIKNNYQGEELKQASYKARFITRLALLPDSVRDNLKKITGTENINGNQEAKAYQMAAREIGQNEKAIKSIEYIRGVINFRKRFDNIVGGSAVNLGKFFKSERLGNWGKQIINRVNTIQWGEINGAMTTWIGYAQSNKDLNFNWALNKISDSWLSTGSLNPIGWGEKLGGLTNNKLLGGFGKNLLTKGNIALKKGGINLAVGLKKGGINLAAGLKGMATKLFPKLAGALGKVALGTVALPLLILSSFDLKEVFKLIVYVVGGLFVGLLVIIPLLIMGGPISSLVPTTGAGGGQNCVLKSKTKDGGGVINCDQNAPANDFRGMVSKETFVGVAGNWKSGTNYSKECFNDTVNKALCAGINPAYALRTWLFESGASNYSDGKAVSDFGIASIMQPKNFSAQIETFLKLDPASACLGKPLIGNDYWLAYATNFLTGDPDCNPDKIASGITGRQYKKMIEDSWRMVSYEGLPASIHVDKGGQNCGGGGNNSLESAGTSEYTDENGQTWVCSGDNRNEGGGGGSMVPAEPIYDDSCSESPAYCVVKYLLENGVLDITRVNAPAVVNLINQWRNAPTNFNKDVFNSAMLSSTQAFDGFQCVGFAVGVNPNIGATAWGNDTSSWNVMIDQGSGGCPRIEPSGAGVGDFVLFPIGSWYHIVVISKLRSDGSFAISQANWGSPGRISNVEGSSIQSYLSGKSVLRCR